MAGLNDASRFSASRITGAVLVAVALGSFGLPGPIGAGPTEGRIQGEERARILDRLRERQGDVVTLRAMVVQRRRNPLLKAEVVSHGTLQYRRPNRVRWEVDTPERMILLINDHTLLTYHPDRREAERRDLREDFKARAAVEFFTSGMNLGVDELERRFEVDLYREDGRILLRLTPRSRWVAQAVASIAVDLQEADAVPRHIVILGQKGDRTETTLTNVILNSRLPDDTFTLQFGPDVTVTDVGRMGDEKGSDR